MFWLRILVPSSRFHVPFLRRSFLGSLVAGATLFLFLGVRPDIASAMESVRFLSKFVIELTLAVAATGAALHLARPGDT
jgi:hypothetical protein